MSRNNQQSTCGNSAYGNQRLTIKHCLQDCPQWKDSRKKHSIQGEGLWSGEDDEVTKRDRDV